MLGCLDVTLKWEEDVVEVRRLSLETALTIGNGDEDLFVPLPAGEESHPLLERPHPGAAWTLCAAPGMDGRVFFDDGAVPLHEVAPPGPDGTRRLVLDGPVFAEVSVGAFCLEVRPDRAHAAALVPFELDRPLAHSTMPASALMVALVAAFWLTPEPVHAEEPALAARRVLQTRIAVPQPVPVPAPNETTAPSAPPPGARAQVPQEARAAAGAGERAARELMGALAGLGGDGGASGELMDALSGVVAAGTGSGSGLGLRGAAFGGGGGGTHKLAGVLRTSGGAATGFGEGSLCGAGERKDKSCRPDRAPEVQIAMDEPKMCDGACRTLIRRVVNEHKAQVRHCFERALQQTPGIGGRVAIRFLLSPTGRVQTSRVAKDDVGAGVGECIAQKVRRWRFPAMKGAYDVTYPWVFRAR